MTCLVGFLISQKTINSSSKSRSKMEVKFLKISKFFGLLPLIKLMVKVI